MRGADGVKMAVLRKGRESSTLISAAAHARRSTESYILKCQTLLEMNQNMDEHEEFLSVIRKRAAQRILFSAHAIRQMSRPDRMISTTEVRRVLDQGEIIEDYPEDARGHSCLMLGMGTGNRPIHLICSPKDEYLAIITAYLPADDEWMENFKVRRN